MRPWWGIVVNPVHPAARSVVWALTRLLHERGASWDVSYTTPVREGRQQAAQLARRGAAVVAVVGGDGTVRQAARGLLDAAGCAGADTVPLAILPTGGANLFAGSIGAPAGSRRTAEAWVRRICDAPLARVDVGNAGLLTARGTRDEQIFLTMAGMGNDARTIMGVSRTAKAAAGWAAYPLAGLTRLFSPTFAAEVSWRETTGDRHEKSIRAWAILAGNGPGLPVPLRVFAPAVNEGQLEALICAPRARPADRVLDWARIGMSAWQPPHPQAAFTQSPTTPVERRRITDMTITPARPQPVQLDGDIVPAVRELRVTVLPEALRVLAPNIRR